MMRNLVSRLFKGDSHLPSIEKGIFDCVSGKPDAKLLTLRYGPVQAIDKIQPSPEGDETNLCRKKEGVPRISFRAVHRLTLEVALARC